MPFWDKCTKWPQNNLEHFKVIQSPYVLLISTSLKFHSFSLYGQPFSSYRPFWDNCTEWPPKTLNTTRSKVYHTCVTSVPESQILVRFALRPALSMISHFFYNSPLTPMLNAHKKCQKSKIRNFTILYTTLVETFLRGMTEFWAAHLLCTFRQDVVWSFFYPIWSHVNENEKKIKTKIQHLKFRQFLALLDIVSRANAVAQASVVRPWNAFSQKPSIKLTPNFVER